MQNFILNIKWARGQRFDVIRPEFIQNGSHAIWICSTPITSKWYEAGLSRRLISGFERVLFVLLIGADKDAMCKWCPMKSMQIKLPCQLRVASNSHWNSRLSSPPTCLWAAPTFPTPTARRLSRPRRAYQTRGKCAPSASAKNAINMQQNICIRNRVNLMGQLCS